MFQITLLTLFLGQWYDNIMTFNESVTTCLKKYFVFEGRASRSEYWWFQLIVTPSYLISTIIENEIGYFFLGITLFTLIPAISAGVRRLHDTNRSGFFLLISFFLKMVNELQI